MTGWKIGALGTMLGLIGMLVMWNGWTSAAHSRDKWKTTAEERAAEISDLKLDIEIYEAAALQRRIDEEQGRTQREELEDASSNPNDTPAQRRTRRLCMLRQQQQGSEAGVHPACRGPDAEEGAAAP